VRGLSCAAPVRQSTGSRVGQAQRVVQLAVNQSGIGGDRRAAKLQQQTPVEIESLSAPVLASPAESPLPVPFDPPQATEF
jgi:hypothetical protein